jgi:hypothetical protein
LPQKTRSVIVRTRTKCRVAEISYRRQEQGGWGRSFLVARDAGAYQSPRSVIVRSCWPGEATTPETEETGRPPVRQLRFPSGATGGRPPVISPPERSQERRGAWADSPYLAAAAHAAADSRETQRTLLYRQGKRDSYFVLGLSFAATGRRTAIA